MGNTETMGKLYAFPESEWAIEPNRVSFTYKGFECLIVRNDILGFLTGYVAVPEGHVLYGKDYGSEAVYSIDVHGGMTFSEEGMTYINGTGNYFKRFKNAHGKKLWWIGFDCGHAGDLVPYIHGFGLLSIGETYKNIDFVKNEIKSMIDQITVSE